MNGDPNIPKQLPDEGPGAIPAEGSDPYDGIVSLQEAVAGYHPDFPSGHDLTLLMDIRDMIAERVSAMGFKSTGRGVGVGGADVTFSLGDRTLSVRIDIHD